MSFEFRYATRINSFKSRPDLYAWKHGRGNLNELLERMSQVRGLDGVYVNYPEHFQGSGKELLRHWLASGKLKFLGLNIRFPNSEFLDGDFTNPSRARRAQAIDLCKRAADECRELEGAEVVIWPAHDGYDYALQADYETLWNHELEGLAAVAEYAPDQKISVEFKPAEPRRRSLLDSTATTLLAIKQLGHQNLGLTLDYCHVLMAKENPAQSAMLCLKEGRLFGMHMNDGHGFLDDGLAVGAATPTETFELVHYLRQYQFGGAIYFDTFPLREDPVRECELNIAQMERFSRRSASLDPQRLDAVRGQQDALGMLDLIAGDRP